MSDEKENENSIIPHGGESKAKKEAVSMLSSVVGFAGSAADVVGAVHGRYIAARDNEVRARTDIEDGEKSRIVVRAVQQQRNIDTVAEEIPKHMKGDDDAAKVEKLRNINPDVAARSADECKHISDEYMRTLWAKALAGEADNPGSFSIRTARILGDMSQEDAELFRTFCQFIWIEKNWRENFPVSLVYDHQKSVYTDSGITYAALDDLETMGLISHKTQGYARWYPLPSNGAVWNYQGKVDFSLEPQKHPEKNSAFISCGNAALTREGRQLFAVCRDQVWYNAKFMLYVVDEWRARNFNPTHLSDTGDAGKFGG